MGESGAPPASAADRACQQQCEALSHRERPDPPVEAGCPRSGDGALLCPAQFPGAPEPLVTYDLIGINSDTLGLLMAVIVTAASVSDPAGARLLFARLGGACKKLRLIWVDGTYRGQLVEWVSQHMRFVLRVTLRPEGTKGFVLLPRRWVVERTLAWLNQSRRLSKDYERLPKSSEAMIYLSMTRLMLRRLAAA